VDEARDEAQPRTAVLFLSTRPLSLTDVEILHWGPYLERREAGAREEEGDARQQPGR
jgi:hypothetical protein